MTVVVVACGGGGGTSGALQPTSAAGKRGLALVDKAGCQACHTANGKKAVGPSWKDLAGSTVKLDDGTTVVADGAYLTRAITKPKDQVVAGYAGIMPGNSLGAREVDDVIAYLRELSTKTSG